MSQQTPPLKSPSVAAQPARTPSRFMQRQCACGNHTIAGGECEECSKRKNFFQRKLTIGASDDPLEREADRIADQVTKDLAPVIVGPAPACLQRFAGKATKNAPNAPAIVDHVLASSGQPLVPAIRQDMESRFSHDFSRVRVHTDEQAAASAVSVDARAYTAGSHIVFGADQYTPETGDGRRLIAHELVHVVQQGFAPVEPGLPSQTKQNASGRGTTKGTWSRQVTSPLLQRSPPKAQVPNDPRPVKEDARHRIPVASPRTNEKILKFNGHNSDLGSDVLGKIRSGVLLVTDLAGTDEVAYSFFDFYSSAGKTLRKMTVDEERKAKASDRLLDTSPGWFATTTVRTDALNFDSVKLANLLLHEFAHTGDTPGNLSGSGNYQEGHAYGIEYFYAKAAGDTNRTNAIQGIVADGTVLGYAKAYDLDRFQEDFKVTYALMTALKELVENGSSSHLPFQKLNPAGAKLLEQQVVVNFHNPSAELRAYIAHVKATLDSFDIPKLR